MRELGFLPCPVSICSQLCMTNTGPFQASVDPMYTPVTALSPECVHRTPACLSCPFPYLPQPPNPWTTSDSQMRPWLVLPCPALSRILSSFQTEAAAPPLGPGSPIIPNPPCFPLAWPFMRVDFVLWVAELPSTEALTLHLTTARGWVGQWVTCSFFHLL